ncbi:MAG: hypothetical protein ACRC4M_01045, partial [Mycoplasma sp.]
QQLMYLNSLNEDQLINLYEKYGAGWKSKGFEAFSWFLSSLDNLGKPAYWCAAIFALIAFPIMTYYLSAMMIILFPKKKKIKKQKNNPETEVL